jgi:hypothetical protein|tara:strand:- start:361 stop:915 length:555 start_codon:yes stop_codon:yes gene_type:complete
MAEFLFISPTEIKQTTIVGGNLDDDKFVFVISDAMNTTILPLLGQQLYDVILAGADAGTLTGLYLELYTKFVKPITKFQTVANFILISNYMVTNGGSVSHTSDNAQLMSAEELTRLSNTYAGMADTFIDRFDEWIVLNYLAEYKTTQDGVDASKHINNRSGWFFGAPSNRLQDPYPQSPEDIIT